MHIPAIIDLEASGFGRGSYPIEVGVALEDGTIHAMLIAPADGWDHWDESAEKIHGISREYLKEHGKTVREVAIFLNDLCSGQTLYSDAWSFDSITRLLNEDELERWSDVKDQTGQGLGLELHRAANDVKLLRETYKTVRS